MQQPQEQRIDVHAKRIPIEVGTRRSHYSPQKREVSVDTETSPTGRVVDNYKEFCSYVDLIDENGKRRSLNALLSKLPQTLRSSCKVFEYFDHYPKITLIINPADAEACLREFQRVAQFDVLSEVDEITLELITDQIQIPLDEKEARGPTDPKLKDMISEVEGIVWNQYQKLLEDPEKFREKDIKGIRNHELRHLAVIESRWHGLLSVIYRLNGLVSDLEGQHIDGEQKARADRLQRAHNLIRALLESDAYIHQSMATSVLSEQHHYDHANICSRLIELTRMYHVFEGQTEMAVDLTLKSEDVIKDHKERFLEHPAGTMFLLLAPDLAPERLIKDFRLVEPDVSDLERTRLQLLERTLPLVRDPQYAEQYLIGVYEKIQTLLQLVTESFNQEFLSYCQDYPDAVGAVSPVFLWDLDQYHQFLQEYPDPFDHQGVNIQPVERRGVRGQKQTVMRRLLSLARRSFTSH